MNKDDVRALLDAKMKVNIGLTLSEVKAIETVKLDLTTKQLEFVNTSRGKIDSASKQRAKNLRGLKVESDAAKQAFAQVEKEKAQLEREKEAIEKQRNQLTDELKAERALKVQKSKNLFSLSKQGAFLIAGIVLVAGVLYWSFRTDKAGDIFENIALISIPAILQFAQIYGGKKEKDNE